MIALESSVVSVWRTPLSKGSIAEDPPAADMDQVSFGCVCAAVPAALLFDALQRDSGPALPTT